MDFSKLEQNEKTAAIGAVVLVIAGIIAAATYLIYGLAWLAVIAALALLFVIFQPQIATGVNLPGTKGSLMVLLGGIAGVVMLLALLMTLSLVFVNFGFPDIMFLVAVAAGLATAWAGWQAFQAEGGKFQLGAPSAETSATTTSAPPSETVTPPSATTAPPPPAGPPADAEAVPPPTSSVDTDEDLDRPRDA